MRKICKSPISHIQVARRYRGPKGRKTLIQNLPSTFTARQSCHMLNRQANVKKANYKCPNWCYCSCHVVDYVTEMQSRWGYRFGISVKCFFCDLHRRNNTSRWNLKAKIHIFFKGGIEILIYFYLINIISQQPHWSQFQPLKSLTKFTSYKETNRANVFIWLEMNEPQWQLW